MFFGPRQQNHGSYGGDHSCHASYRKCTSSFPQLFIHLIVSETNHFYFHFLFCIRQTASFIHIFVKKDLVLLKRKKTPRQDEKKHTGSRHIWHRKQPTCSTVLTSFILFFFFIVNYSPDASVEEQSISNWSKIKYIKWKKRKTKYKYQKWKLLKG